MSIAGYALLVIGLGTLVVTADDHFKWSKRFLNWAYDMILAGYCKMMAHTGDVRYTYKGKRYAK